MGVVILTGASASGKMSITEVIAIPYAGSQLRGCW